MGFLFRCNLCGTQGTETWVREEAEEEEAQHREAEPSHFELNRPDPAVGAT